MTEIAAMSALRPRLAIDSCRRWRGDESWSEEEEEEEGRASSRARGVL